MPLSLDKIAALAPDQGSVDAARKLLKSAGWPKLSSDGGGLLWGECQGSGTPYRVAVSESDAGYKCTCPSRKFPCKHALALMWLRAEGKVAFSPDEPPDWVKEWMNRRRAPGTLAPAAEGDKPKVSLGSSAAVEEEADPKALARAAAARERNRQERETSMLAGLEELDLWLEDQVGRGIIAFVAQSGAACRVIAQRLVDAKASGLASRVDALPSRLFSLPEAMRPMAAVEELGQLHLIAQAYRRQGELSPALKADVRQAVGWTISREDLLADRTAEREQGIWRVVAVRNEVQPDKLRRIETWLQLQADGRFALLLDFVPVGTGASSGGYVVGEALEAELVFYPSAAPLRALVVRSSGAQVSRDTLIPAKATLGEAYTEYETALRLQPWLTVWPLSFRSARVRQAGKVLFICNAEGAPNALPLEPSQTDLAEPLLAIERLDAVALWNGRYCTLCWAETFLGRWVAE